jgi:hypothetical protein
MVFKCAEQFVTETAARRFDVLESSAFHLVSVAQAMSGRGITMVG